MKVAVLPPFMLLAGALIGVLVSSSSIVHGKQEPLTDPASGCCHILNDLLPNKVSWPGDPTYDAQQSSYYSASQRKLQPQCRISPTTPADVSTIMKTTSTRHRTPRCKFAVRSGGHMSFQGASNIDGTGFTVDLQSLETGISLSEDKKTVSFGAGYRWRDVYRELAVYNLTTVGGRVGDVGVGGFLLGGGISFLTPKHGFGSDNIVNYEIVLANGSIVNANVNDHADLYWALKLGSTNFGIVTRFDMATFPQGQAWGGSQFYAIDDARALLEKLVTFTKNLVQDPKGFFGLTLVWNAAQQNYIVWTLQTYLDPIPFPPSLWSNFEEVKPLIDTTGVKSLMDITEEFQEADPGKHGRSLWSSMTYKANVQFHLDLHQRGVELFGAYQNRPGVLWGVGVQPLPRNVSEAALNSGGSPLNLSGDDGELWVMIFTSDWLDPADDEVMIESSRQLIHWAETEATHRGLFHPFVYMNYAAGFEDVMVRSTGKNLKKMMEVKKVYDPNDLLDETWMGGFKLPRKKQEHDRSEL
ncbi:hypothetical protein E1B28_007111 [Marasmius oreades]|uniref:FAD-binding PCMH-type domain-containing protein n=1 Tax=Marasmius oreades TaxID=181124 RepID=A0A9P7S160_9AGAR|nr:uncharacterized protein E1B28_007111 [Marasmius oreades]KAG7093432.1 hypothetical protein E1B28_007111 [Marasmius oreades]